MKTILSLIGGLGFVLGLHAGSTINIADRFAYGANIGWMDWRGEGSTGVVIGEYVCSGFIYSANCGWINLGSGSPANGIYYQNLSANDFGVNQDGLGNLRGFAWGANIGWVNFESMGAPKVDLSTGKLSGHVWGANVGWISLSNVFAFVLTDTIAPGADSDHNGLPDAWEYQYFGHIGVSPGADPDGDGYSNLQEHLADTNPNDADSLLSITSFIATSMGTSDTITWTSRPTRQYHVQRTSSLSQPTSWTDIGLGLISPDAGPTTTRAFTDSASPQDFFRIRAIKPLSSP